MISKFLLSSVILGWFCLIYDLKTNSQSNLNEEVIILYWLVLTLSVLIFSRSSCCQDGCHFVWDPFLVPHGSEFPFRVQIWDRVRVLEATPK